VDDGSNLDGRLRDVFAAVFNTEREAISPEMSMRTFAGWDSLRQIQLVLALEDEFKVSFSEQEVGTLASFSLFADALRKRAAR
jgi:acyl carrier protein